MAAHIDIAGVRAFLLQNLVKRPDGWAWRVNLDALAVAQDEIIGWPSQPQGAVFGRPVSFIHGELSDYVKPAHDPEILRLFPAANLCPVAQAGHWVYAEQPRGFMACLDDYLSRLTGVVRTTP
jgi:pimeloyl-ACP methyl ester carboxylesterase